MVFRNRQFTLPLTSWIIVVHGFRSSTLHSSQWFRSRLTNHNVVNDGRPPVVWGYFCDVFPDLISITWIGQGEYLQDSAEMWSIGCVIPPLRGRVHATSSWSYRWILHMCSLSPFTSGADLHFALAGRTADWLAGRHSFAKWWLANFFIFPDYRTENSKQQHISLLEEMVL